MEDRSRARRSEAEVSQPTPSAPRKPFWKSGAFQLVLGILVSAFCIWLAGRSIWNDPVARKQLVEAFRTADYSKLPLLWLVLALFYWIKAWRWRMLLSPIGDYKTTRECLPPLLIGFAFNNVLPAHLGEFVRIFVFARQQRVAKTSVFTTVALERVLDILAILAYLGTGLLAVQGVSAGWRRGAIVIGAVALAGVVGAFAFVLYTRPMLMLVEAVLARLPFVPEGLRAKIIGLVESSAAGLASLKNPLTLAGLIVTSLVQWGLNGLLIHWSLQSFGVTVEPVVSLIVLGVVAFGVTVPSSPGYFGVIQLCFTEVLMQFPVNQPAVFAASVYYHMIQYVPVTLIGLILFAMTGLQLKDVERTTEAATPA
jgi:uncharacterized protein (TIRG00374 family)